MTHTRFQKISVKGKRRWKDESGKWHQETRKFWQTINPFNRDADGVKTYEKIVAEVKSERDAWLMGGGN